jgi:hypothetical protein
VSDLLLTLAWYPADQLSFARELGADERRLRPLSLASFQAIRLMGLLHFIDRTEDNGATLAETTRFVRLYIWLHSEDIDVINRALWDGSWAALIEADDDEACAPIIDAWQRHRERLAALIEAAAIEVVPRPKSDHDDTPWNVVGPVDLAHKIATIARCTGWTRDHILWELPLAQALQIYHAELRWHSLWTVRPGKPVPDDAFEDFDIAAISETLDPHS